jgi:hypothetical protein
MRQDLVDELVTHARQCAGGAVSTKEAVVTPNTQPKQPNESLVAKSLPIMLPLLLPILYAGVVALVRNSYVRFYSDYGVTPEDVGFEQGQVLSGIFRFCLAGNFLRSYTLLKIVILLDRIESAWSCGAWHVWPGCRSDWYIRQPRATSNPGQFRASSSEGSTVCLRPDIEE